MRTWLGQRRVAVIPTVVQDSQFDPPPPNFAELVRARFFYDGDTPSGVDRSLRRYIHETSYGRAQLLADVFDPVTVPFRPADCGAMQDDAIRTLPAGHAYEYACVVFTGGTHGCRGWAFWDNPPFPGTTSLRNWCYVSMGEDLGVWAMELTHAICAFDDLYKTTDANPDRWDNMACSCGTHPSTFTKLKFGWLDPNDVRTMGGAETGTFTLHALGLLQPPPPGRAVALRIASDVSQRYFLVEARLPVDAYESVTAGVSAGIPGEGVVVYEIDESVWAPVHVRTPSALSVGQTYTNAAEQLEVAVAAQVPGGFTVQVSSTEHPDCAQIRAAIDEANAEIAALQEELSTAAPPEKPAIVRQIRQWQATLKEQQQRGTQLGCRLS
jgi:hypothetical protein